MRDFLGYKAIAPPSESLKIPLGPAWGQGNRKEVGKATAVFSRGGTFPVPQHPHLPRPSEPSECRGAALPSNTLSNLVEVRSELPPEDQITAPPHLQVPRSPGSQPCSPGDLRPPTSLAFPPRKAASILEPPSPSTPASRPSFQSHWPQGSWASNVSFKDPSDQSPTHPRLPLSRAQLSFPHLLGPSSPCPTPQGGGLMYYKTPPMFSSKAFINS